MILVLGQVRLRTSTAETTPALDRKARELLTVLAMHAPAALGAEELSRILWDRPPETALRTVRSHLSRIRAAVRGAGFADPIVSAHGQTYRLAPQTVTDVGEVSRLRAEARHLLATQLPSVALERLTVARGLCAGLPELPGTTAGLALRRGWERDQQSLALEQLALVVAGERPGDAIGELLRITSLDPLDEPAWVLLVRALHAEGRQADALQAVARARSELHRVGLDPGPELVAAQAVVLAGEPRPAPASEVPARRAGPTLRYTADAATAYLELSSAGTDPKSRSEPAPPSGRGRRPRGGTDLVILNPGTVTIDGLLDEPHSRAALTTLAGHLRVLSFDRRGIGLSSPLSVAADPLTQWVDDVLQVSIAADAPRPVLLANFDSCLIALAYAVRHPQRVAGLVLDSGFARYQRAPDYPYGLDAGSTSTLIAAAVDPSRERPLDTAALVAPSLAGDLGFREWWNRIGHRGASPATARIVREVATSTDLRDRLGEVGCPVLVCARRQCQNLDPGHSRFLHEQLPRAELLMADGADSLWFADPGPMIDRLIGFATAVTQF